MKRIAAWMFSCSKPPENSLRVFWWWEFRRIPFNIVIGVWGAICLMAYTWGVSAVLTHGEDAVEPVALFLAPVVINGLYTLGCSWKSPCDGCALECPFDSARCFWAWVSGPG